MALEMDVALIKIISSCPIKTTGTLKVILYRLSSSKRSCPTLIYVPSLSAVYETDFLSYKVYYNDRVRSANNVLQGPKPLKLFFLLSGVYPRTAAEVLAEGWRLERVGWVGVVATVW